MAKDPYSYWLPEAEEIWRKDPVRSVMLDLDEGREEALRFLDHRNQPANPD